MDILGSGPPAESGRAQATDWDAETDLDPDAEDEEREDPAPPRRLLADLVSAEALAVAGLAVGVTSLAGPSWVTMLLFVTTDASGPVGDQERLRQYALLHGAAAVLTMALGAAALLRRPMTGPAWVRALAGAATIVGLVLVLIALVLLQRSLGLADPSGSGSFGGATG